MAATDLSTASPGTLGLYVKRVSLEASAGNARQVRVPSWARYILLTFTDSSAAAAAGSYASAGTDGSAIGTDAMPVPSGGTATLPVAAGGSIYLAGSAGGYAILTLAARG